MKDDMCSFLMSNLTKTISKMDIPPFLSLAYGRLTYVKTSIPPEHTRIPSPISPHLKHSGCSFVR